MSRALNINDVMIYLGLDGWDGDAGQEVIKWPPDVFACMTYLLRESGSYIEAVKPCPNGNVRLQDTPDRWEKRIRDAATEWAWTDDGEPPELVVELWKQVQAAAKAEVCSINADDSLWPAIVELACIADQACRGVGLPTQVFTDAPTPNQIGLKYRAIRILLEQVHSGTRASLCKLIHPSRAVVLPKMRAPQRGITIRSMSHHLALCTGSDICARWVVTPATPAEGDADLPAEVQPPPQRPKNPDRRAYNVLLVPWPLEVAPSQFEPLPGHETLLRRMPEKFDFFSFRPTPVPKDFAAKIDRLIERATAQVGPLHGLVLPEMALSPADFEMVFQDQLPTGLQFLVCGIYEPPSQTKLAANYAAILQRTEGTKRTLQRQEKHHRWALDHDQICSYGIGSALDPQKVWWEGTDLRHRDIHFFALDDICVFTVLICEDLARPDPVGDIIRAVGPNLVIALLQDGPQLNGRWPSRHATALADDPGCSVLTITGLGMASLSRPAGKDDPSKSRVVAMWRDAATGTREIHLPPHAHGLVLTLTESPFNEFTADGRSDHGAAGSIRLGGINAVSWNE